MAEDPNLLHPVPADLPGLCIFPDRPGHHGVWWLHPYPGKSNFGVPHDLWPFWEVSS